ncbi:GTPase-associated system all-helical protein GASH [Burkholderia ambifaria]|uniref:GTPase-associated system all-helical protein GASH n=1 Tax=Burkholderia ambifaria TaxID=152480 RepID=UPI00158B4740|nr:GTPase-associated system all-helical protein GASH [Burkholderia ambifaria]
MANVLQEFLAAGLIHKIGGDDDRLTKMEKAAATIAEAFKKDAMLLIPAILAVLDGTAIADDPVIRLAESALLAEWKTLASVHPDTPINIYRAILAMACEAVAHDKSAVILWLTAADILPFCQLGKEAPIVFKLVSGFAEKAERHAVSQLSSPQRKKKGGGVPAFPSPEIEGFKVDNDALRLAIGNATMPAPANVQYGPNQNRYWIHQSPQQWAQDFIDRMAPALSERFNAVGEHLAESEQRLAEAITSAFDALAKSVQETIAASESFVGGEQVRLDTVWWYESLYSPSLRKSYREVSPAAAAALMPLDLIAITPAVIPASVGYVLSEAVARLPDAGYDRRVPLVDVLGNVMAARTDLPVQVIDSMPATPSAGRLSLRDIIRLALTGASTEPADLLHRARLPADAEISLPHFARTMMRQEQAVRLAGAKK